MFPNCYWWHRVETTFGTAKNPHSAYKILSYVMQTESRSCSRSSVLVEAFCLPSLFWSLQHRSVWRRSRIHPRFLQVAHYLHQAYSDTHLHLLMPLFIPLKALCRGKPRWFHIVRLLQSRRSLGVLALRLVLTGCFLIVVKWAHCSVTGFFFFSRKTASSHCKKQK